MAWIYDDVSIAIVGDHGVGKTQICNRYLFDTFESSHFFYDYLIYDYGNII